MIEKEEIKTALYQHCVDSVDRRLKVCHERISKVQDDLQAETKSSAGDKHETGRAMLQLEREKLGHQLAVIEKDRDFLLQMQPIPMSTDRVRKGSVIATSMANYFVAISAGEIKLNHKNYYAISADSPIGRVLIGKRVGDKVQFRNQEFKILDIF